VKATNAVGAKYESIGSVIDGYARSLESNVQEWQEISGGFASYVKVFSDAVEVAHKSSLEDKEKLIVATKIMQNMMDVLQTSQNNVKASMDAVTSISQEIKGNVGTLQGIAKEIKSGMDGIRDFEPKINSSLADVIKTNNEYVEKWAQAYNQTIKLSIENLQTAVKDNNAFVSKWAGAYNETITNSIKQMQSAVSTAVKTQNESVQEWARAYQETVQFSMKELRATIEKLAG
jgi:phage-related protein